MFEPGFDQAAGLRASLPGAHAALVPLASPAQPSRAFEWLCHLAAELAAQDREVIVVDATARETAAQRDTDDASLGLHQALQDPSMAQLGATGEAGEWRVMPGALGLDLLLDTARHAGPKRALARLLAPFAGGALVLLFAPPQALSALLGGCGGRVLVPVLPQAQASIDAYGAVKLLQQAGLNPVLAPAIEAPAQVVSNVVDCAARYLNHSLSVWPSATWALRAQESALIPAGDTTTPRLRGAHGRATHSLWS
ncbi:hypothetical protein [Hydrogenophaga sp.]|uniref:hypothetical protein n=1 Tax=Hydrogenophaga sp. TaxID=1904254 RepID=UPI00391B9C9C